MVSELQISKLPKWAQERIATLERERDSAVAALNEWTDNQTLSPIFVDDYVCTGEDRGGTRKVRYIQTRRLRIEWKGVDLEIILAEDDSQRTDGVHLQWSGPRKLGGSMIALVPKGFQSAELVAKENMR